MLDLNDPEVQQIIEAAVQAARRHNHDDNNSSRIREEDLRPGKIHDSPPTAANLGEEGTQYLYSDGSFIYIYRKHNGVWLRHY